MPEEIITTEFSDEFKKELISIIKRSLKGEALVDREAIILFHWVRHQTDPAYDFVPAKYRTLKLKKSKKKGMN